MQLLHLKLQALFRYVIFLHRFRRNFQNSYLWQTGFSGVVECVEGRFISHCLCPYFRVYFASDLATSSILQRFNLGFYLCECPNLLCESKI